MREPGDRYESSDVERFLEAAGKCGAFLHRRMGAVDLASAANAFA
jgi:hypothetical protein